MDKSLQAREMLERVELIARLTTIGNCKERDREIALNLIAEIAGDLLSSRIHPVIFAAHNLN